MITSNCDFTGLIRDIKAIAADLEPRGQGAPCVFFMARLIALGDMVSEAVKMIREAPGLNGLYWEIVKFYADQKRGEKNDG